MLFKLYFVRDRGTHTFLCVSGCGFSLRVHVCETGARMSFLRRSDGRRGAVSLIEIIEILISEVFMYVDATPVTVIPLPLSHGVG